MIKQIFANIIEKNSGFEAIEIIRDILKGKIQQESLDIEFNITDIVNMNYTPITSVDMEESFSSYNKSILRTNRRHFYYQNFNKILFLISLFWNNNNSFIYFNHLYYFYLIFKNIFFCNFQC